MGNFKRKHIYPLLVPIEFELRKIRIKTDRLYRKIWGYLYVLLMLPFIVAGTCQIVKDYKRLSNVANIDAFNTPQYTSWRTDGNPGQNPPNQ